ncbi:MAG: hypothetical protein RR384_08245 [Acidaminococcaceae bacterium]
MTLAEILAFLRAAKDGDKYAEGLDKIFKERETILTQNKETITQLQKDAKTHKGVVDGLTAKIEKFADALGVSEEDEDLDTAIETALKSKGGTGDLALQRKVERLTKQLNETTTKLTEQVTSERGKRHAAMVQNALVTALTEQKAVDPTTLVDLFKGSVKVADDDSMTFGEDGKSIKDGVSAWLQAHPTFVSNDQKPGAGGGDNGGGGKDTFAELATSLAKSKQQPEGGDPAAAYFK